MDPFYLETRSSIPTPSGLSWIPFASVVIAVSMGEWQPDAAGVAAPILGAGAEIQAALTISGPIQRYTPEVIDDFAARILKVTRMISSQMGYTR